MSLRLRILAGAGLVLTLACSADHPAAPSQAVLPPDGPPAWEVFGDTFAINRGVPLEAVTMQITLQYSSEAPDNRLAPLMLAGVREVSDDRNRGWSFLTMTVRGDALDGLVGQVAGLPWAKILYAGTDGTYPVNFRSHLQSR